MDPWSEAEWQTAGQGREGSLCQGVWESFALILRKDSPSWPGPVFSLCLHITHM